MQVMSLTCATPASLHAAVANDGYAFVQGAAMREMLAPFGSLADWTRFADSWDDLAVDTYMADGGRYRRRRYSVYGIEGERVRRESHQPHFQALDYNPLNGGVARWFEPMAADVGDGATLRTILGFCGAFFGGIEQQRVGTASRRTESPLPWRAEVHQFRIEARLSQAGLPTPEGLHRDGVDYVLVLLVHRRNIASGTTSVHAADGTRLGEFTLTDPFDAALLDDRRVAHGVTAVEALDPAVPAYRDVLVATLVRP